jgi:hypothetical protein
LLQIPPDVMHWGEVVGDEPGDQGAGAWHGFDSASGVPHGPHHAHTRVADAWASRVGDQGQYLSGPQAFDNLFASLGFVEFKIAQQRLGDIIMSQQQSGVPGVLGGDGIALF